MKLTSEKILNLLDAKLLHKNLFHSVVSNISFDSRKIIFGPKSLFFAFQTTKDDGHKYINDAYEKGVRNFVVSKKVELLKEANYFHVDDTLTALQNLAQAHRDKVKAKIIGITGSYGKTIVKDGLYDVLKSNYAVVKSPNSYNSQIGVCLSILQIQKHHEIAIIEAGISEPGEMTTLQKIINPDFGVFTTLGKAHDYHFENREQKLKEKLILFKDCNSIIAPLNLEAQILELNPKWSNSVVFTNAITTSTYSDQIFEQNRALIKAACSVWGFSVDNIDQQLKGLGSGKMRLQVEKGKSGNLIINDAYIADNDSLRLALDFFAQQSGAKRKVLIISDFEISKENAVQEYLLTNKIINEHHIDEVLILGNSLGSFIDHPNQISFSEKRSLLAFIQSTKYSNTAFLIKGSRKNKMESISDFLVAYIHDTILQINLSALEHNVKSYGSMLKGNTEIIAVIKAGAYGSGSVEIAQTLVQTGIKYLAVAFSEEAIVLRENGIEIPIIILNPQSSAQELWFSYQLQPIVYGMAQLKSIKILSERLEKTLDIHININTGLNRLGLEDQDISEAIEIIKDSRLNLSSAFTHLSASEDSSEDHFSHQQVEHFLTIHKEFVAQGLPCKKHVLNSSGIARFPDFHFDMVRLGIGLYGIHLGPNKPDLQKVHALKTKIIQIRELELNESVSYNRRFKAEKKTKIATLPIGYADGLPRSAGNGNFKVLIQNIEASIIGNVCMDLTMINIDHIENVNIGDEVVVFNEELDIEALAKACNSIPYEILCNISPRVKRILLRE